MDIYLQNSVNALKDILHRRNIPASFGSAAPDLLHNLQTKLLIPSRYKTFLQSANPVSVETVTPTERIHLISAEALATSQFGQTPLDGMEQAQWRKSWIIIGRSALLGDAYFIDVSRLDTLGDCPVFTCITGGDVSTPVLCASSFQQFIQILALSMEVAIPFDTNAQDEDTEIAFREALAPKLKAIDASALRAGH